MANSLHKLLENNTLRKQMGVSAREYVTNKFGSEQILKQWENFYESINARA